MSNIAEIGGANVERKKECHELAEKYFETHKQMTLPGQALRVDLRPAFRKPLADVVPKFRAVSIGYTFTPQQ
jgi:hypothetical protein